MFNFFRKLKLLLKLINNIEISKEGNITINRSLNISIDGDLMLGTSGHHVEYSATGCKVMYYRKIFSGDMEHKPVLSSFKCEDIVLNAIHEANTHYEKNNLPYRISTLTYKTNTIEIDTSISLMKDHSMCHINK
jgi:hypothetical protein